MDVEEIREWARGIVRRGYYKCYWSTHALKIQPGDRVFLMKLGVEPRGIVASGCVVSDVDEGPNWDKNAKSETANYVEIKWDVALDPDERIFPIKRLRKGIYSKMCWSPRASGVAIPDKIAAQLEKDWAPFVMQAEVKDSAQLKKENKERKRNKRVLLWPEEVDSSKTYMEGATRQVTVNAYERNEKARKRCVEHYGLECSVCGFNFERTYGEIGKGFIHVHHLKPLAEIRKRHKLDPINDLRPICPNCHAMLHQGYPAYTIEELKAIVKRAARKNCAQR